MVEQISEREVRVLVDPPKPLGPLAMLGYAKKFGPVKTTKEWMDELREGERE
jgi:hypothetical protein